VCGGTVLLTQSHAIAPWSDQGLRENRQSEHDVRVVFVLVRMSETGSAVAVVVVRMRVGVFVDCSHDDSGCRFDPLDNPTLMERRSRAHTRHRTQHHRERSEEPDGVQYGATRKHD
jgi:hypothetical protein